MLKVYQSDNPYSPTRSEVLDVKTETPTIKTIKLRPETEIGFKTGQFIELSVPGLGEAPFTPSSSPSEKETLEISVMNVGKVTRGIHTLQAGDTVGVRGPFGTGYPMEDFVGKEVLVVGGGCGFAPLRSLMYELFETSGQYQKLLFRGGCRSPKDFLYADEIRTWGEREDLDIQLTVDEGADDWEGNVGVVTTILENLDMDTTRGIGIVCGPPVMMKFATFKLKELGFADARLYLSMEKNMSCGFGKCGHCRLGPYYTCKDGPVFRYDKISDLPNIWE
jgi:NAD(P)H-flavin reductase